MISSNENLYNLSPMIIKTSPSSSTGVNFDSLSGPLSFDPFDSGILSTKTNAVCKYEFLFIRTGPSLIHNKHTTMLINLAL